MKTEYTFNFDGGLIMHVDSKGFKLIDAESRVIMEGIDFDLHSEYIQVDEKCFQIWKDKKIKMTTYEPLT